jgi:hypothetical protein
MRGARDPFSLSLLCGMAGLLALPLTSVSIAAAESTVPRFDKEECWFTVPKGRSATCGRFVTLEDRAKPEGRQVRLPIVVIKASGGSRQADPVVFLSGGPGQGVGVDKDNMKDWWGYDKHWSWMKSRDLILFEQRGTGIAEPSLDCPEVNERGVELMQGMQDQEQVRAIYGRVWSAKASTCRNTAAPTRRRTSPSSASPSASSSGTSPACPTARGWR